MHPAGHLGVRAPLPAAGEDRAGSADLGAAEDTLPQVRAGTRGWRVEGVVPGPHQGTPPHCAVGPGHFRNARMNSVLELKEHGVLPWKSRDFRNPLQAQANCQQREGTTLNCAFQLTLIFMGGTQRAVCSPYSEGPEGTAGPGPGLGLILVLMLRSEHY